MKLLLPICLTCFLGIPAVAESAVRKLMDFLVTVDVGFGKEVCVLGAHPLLGGGNPLRAPKLTWSSGNVWRGKVALEAGTTFAYQFISRDFAPGVWTSSTNSVVIGTAQSVITPQHVPPPWGGKCIIYQSMFSQPRILYRDLTHGGAWTERVLQPVGPGRSPAEQTFRLDALAPSGSELEFVFHNGSGVFDNAPAPPTGSAQGGAPVTPAPYAGISAPYNYRTALDVFLVQYGSVYNDFPPAVPSAPRFETRQIASTVASVPGRPITVFLPRGYDQNLRKRYPVVYFHDGQNVFFPGGPFGTWDADRIARYEISQGRMREAILVSIPNGNEFGSNRLREYLPDGETINYAGTSYTGNANAYARFILENIIPTLDFNYRTLPGPANTFTAGSSMGGLVSDYLGFSYPDRFGGIGIFSPAYWAAPRWVGQRDSAAKLPLRRYLYMGTAESSTGESSSNIYWRGALQAYDAWMKVGHGVNGDLRFDGGAGEAHNEAAWSRRLPAFFNFMLDPWREPNPLAQALFPPKVELTQINRSTGEAVIQYTGMIGTAQSMQNSGNLQGWSAQPLPAETELWQTREVVLPLPLPAPLNYYWRLSQESWPVGP